MKLFFLEAPMALTKQIALTATGEIEKTPYPNAYEVTSHEEDITSLRGFEVALKTHAAHGHCLVKGELNRPLVAESRAGTTDTNAPTWWLCLDIDGLPDVYIPDVTTTTQVAGKPQTTVTKGTAIKVTVETLLDALGLAGVSCIVQWSASYGISDTYLRCHIYILLDKPYPAPLIKQWLIDKNLSTPMLCASLKLTKTGNALSWPLDASACQNDKLIYIAPPVLKGIKDPMGKTPRVHLIKKGKDRFTLGAVPNTTRNREVMHKRLDELRQADGLPKRKTTYKMHGSMEVLVKPDVCLVTETKTERGFVYFNLNGGDSWAYFHPEDNPDYIYNFKGEPVYLTKELLPEYWEELHKQTNRVDSKGIMKLAFLDPKTDRYYRGVYDTLADELLLEPTSSALALRHYCKANGVPLLEDVIPEWNLSFDPHDNVRVDIGNRSINTFQPTQYMRATVRTSRAIPKTIRKVLFHMVGDDPESLERFMNWLAYVLQNRDRALTAWVFHGVPGTGKGTFLAKILRPIWGHEYVAVPRMKELEKEFNSFIDKSLLVCVDEVEAEALQNEKGVMADLRRYITEETIPLRRMHQDARKVRNYSAWIFFSNSTGPIRVSRDDRRVNVAKYQPQKLIISDDELARLETELQAFHDYLMCYQVNKDLVFTPLINQEREDMMELTENAIDTVANALIQGNMGFFIDQLPTDQRYAGDSKLVLKVEDYKAVIHTLLKRTERNNGMCNIARDELRAIFEYTVGKIPESPNKFTSMVKHHRIRIGKVRIGPKVVNGVAVIWKDLPMWSQHLTQFAPAPVSAPAKKTALLARVK